MRASILVFLVLALAWSVRANLLDDLLAKAKTEIEHLKQIAELIKQGKTPKEIIQAALLNHPGVKKPLRVVCDNQLLQKIPFVATACKFIDDNAAEIEATPVPQSRGLLGSLLLNNLNPTGLGGILLTGVIGAPIEAIGKLTEIPGKIIGDILKG